MRMSATIVRSQLAAREAPAERAAAQEVAELALDEARHPDAVGRGGRLREEALVRTTWWSTVPAADRGS